LYLIIARLGYMLKPMLYIRISCEQTGELIAVREKRGSSWNSMGTQFEIVFDEDAITDLDGLRAYDRRAVVDVVQRLLASDPTRVSKTRIKRLRGIQSPQYRLRVGEFRVLYDVYDDEVLVLRVLPKAAVADFLLEMGHEVENGDS